MDQDPLPKKIHEGLRFASVTNWSEARIAYILAHMWFDLATMQGIEDASKARDNAAAKMSPADISKAQRMAREWLANHDKAD